MICTLCVFLEQRVNAEGPGPGAERRLLLGGGEGGRRRRCATLSLFGQGHHPGKGGSSALSGGSRSAINAHRANSFCYWSAAGSSLGWRSSQCVVLTEAGLGRN